MADLNKVMIIGRLGRDPEMRYVPSGSPVTNFSVAVSRRWTSREGEAQEETEWFNIVAWDKLAERANEYLTKGRQVYVEGRLRTRSWEDQNTGEKKYRTEVVAFDIQFLDSRQQAAAGPAATPENDSAFDDMPF